MRILSILILTLTLTACSMGGNVFPDHPDWANEAWERQQQAGSD